MLLEVGRTAGARFDNPFWRARWKKADFDGRIDMLEEMLDAYESGEDEDDEPDEDEEEEDDDTD